MNKSKSLRHEELERFVSSCREQRLDILRSKFLASEGTDRLFKRKSELYSEIAGKLTEEGEQVMLKYEALEGGIAAAREKFFYEAGFADAVAFVKMLFRPDVFM